MNPAIKTSIAPWLSVKNGMGAADFYKKAFGAIESFRLESPDGLVAKLSIDGAEFWVSEVSSDADNIVTKDTVSDAVRMIITVSDPDALFVQALKAGAVEVFPVGEEHGWRIGRLADPFGYHWEIGRPIKK
jgi:PhnB protein